MPFEGIKPATVLRLPQIGSRVPVPVVPPVGVVAPPALVVTGVVAPPALVVAGVVAPPALVVAGVVAPPAPVVTGVVAPPAPVVAGVVAPPFEGATVAPPVLVTPPVLSVVTGELLPQPWVPRTRVKSVTVPT
jgi:hypothetical protein